MRQTVAKGVTQNPVCRLFIFHSTAMDISNPAREASLLQCLAQELGDEQSNSPAGEYACNAKDLPRVARV